jgi:hypothetical protein
MDLKDVYRWTTEYTLFINLNKIEWVVLNPEELQKFYYDNYLDHKSWNFVTDDFINHKPIGMHYLSFSQESPDKRYLLGLCKNKIGKKTINLVTLLLSFNLLAIFFIGSFIIPVNIFITRANKTGSIP